MGEKEKAEKGINYAETNEANSKNKLPLAMKILVP